MEVSYVLTVDGQVFDTATKEQPLDYIHGTKMLIPKFEAEIEGKEAGDTFAFSVAPAEGYGEYNPKRVIKLPLSSFEINGELHRLTKSSVIFMPAGMKHLPLSIISLERPIFHFSISMNPEYSFKPTGESEDTTF